MSQTISETLDLIRADVAVNRRNPKGIVIMTCFRLASWQSTKSKFSPARAIVGVFYRVLIEWILGVELPWHTKIGPGLLVYHGAGIVVNDKAVIGKNVRIWHGVTLGNRTWPGPAPTIGDNVDLGAQSTVLGGVTIGRGAKVGAAAVVLEDVPAGATAVGNPARIVLRADDQ